MKRFHSSLISLAVAISSSVIDDNTRQTKNVRHLKAGACLLFNIFI